MRASPRPKNANRPLDPILPGRPRLYDAARRAGLGRGMRGHVFRWASSQRVDLAAGQRAASGLAGRAARAPHPTYRVGAGDRGMELAAAVRDAGVQQSAGRRGRAQRAVHAAGSAARAARRAGARRRRRAAAAPRASAAPEPGGGARVVRRAPVPRRQGTFAGAQRRRARPGARDGFRSRCDAADVARLRRPRLGHAARVGQPEHAAERAQRRRDAARAASTACCW